MATDRVKTTTKHTSSLFALALYELNPGPNFLCLTHHIHLSDRNHFWIWIDNEH